MSRREDETVDHRRLRSRVRAVDRNIAHGAVTQLTAQNLLRQWDAGQSIWSWRLGGDEHLLHCMAFEILRWFCTRPVDLQIVERFVAGEQLPAQFGLLMNRLEAQPALRNMQPYTATQMALALSLARTLFRNEPIPAHQRIQVRRLVVVAA